MPAARPQASPSRSRRTTPAANSAHKCCGKLPDGNFCGKRLNQTERSYGNGLCDFCYERDRYAESPNNISYEEKLGFLLRTIFLYKQPTLYKLFAVSLMALRPFRLASDKWEGAWNDPGNKAEVYLVEGIVFCAAYASALFFVDQFEYKCQVVARYVRFSFCLTPTWEGVEVELSRVWLVARICAVGGLSLHTILRLQVTANKGLDLQTVQYQLLHTFFYAPSWCLLALWVGSCAELASRTQALTHHVGGLEATASTPDSPGPGGEERPPLVASNSSFTSLNGEYVDPWQRLRRELGSLHADAKALSSWWTVYALGGLVANVHYVSRTFQRECTNDNLTTIPGLIACLRGARPGVLLPMSQPLLLSLFMVLVCEVLPNTANMRLYSQIKSGFLKASKETEDSWNGLLECMERSVPTLRFWLIGRYRVLAVLKCQVLYQVVTSNSTKELAGALAGEAFERIETDY